MCSTQVWYCTSGMPARIRRSAALLPALWLGLVSGAAPQSGTTACHPTLAPAGGGQIADSSFNSPITRPAYSPGAGPRILLDEAHHNFHTLDGRYSAFARLLQRDGFRVEPLRTPASAEVLAHARVLVIANALAERNARGDWTLPTPSAFTAAEIAAIRIWVAGGGSLLLIADHMPFPGAAEDLAAAFGAYLLNGFATDSACAADQFGFRRGDRTLADHPITRGRSAGERVDSVRSFTGQAFRVLPDHQPLLTVPHGTVLLLPRRAWEFSDSTPRLAAEGLVQGAVWRFGRGRVALFGEAAMFSAQLAGRERRAMGMNAPVAAQNPQFLLNLMHWLAGLLPFQ